MCSFFYTEKNVIPNIVHPCQLSTLICRLINQLWIFLPDLLNRNYKLNNFQIEEIFPASEKPKNNVFMYGIRWPSCWRRPSDVFHYSCLPYISGQKSWLMKSEVWITLKECACFNKDHRNLPALPRTHTFVIKNYFTKNDIRVFVHVAGETMYFLKWNVFKTY